VQLVILDTQSVSHETKERLIAALSFGWEGALPSTILSVVGRVSRQAVDYLNRCLTQQSLTSAAPNETEILACLQRMPRPSVSFQSHSPLHTSRDEQLARS
jgi:hypothetical protein